MERVEDVAANVVKEVVDLTGEEEVEGVVDGAFEGRVRIVTEEVETELVTDDSVIEVEKVRKEEVYWKHFLL